MRLLDRQGRPVHDPEFLTIEPSGRIFFSRLPNVATTITLGSNYAYFVYVGHTTQAVLAKYVEFFVNIIAGATSPAEVGLFSTPNPPNKQDQTLTKLWATGTLDSLITPGLKRNSTSFDYIVAAGTHLWAGIRTQVTTPQPTLSGLCMDFSEGLVLSTASAGALTSSNSFSGVKITVPTYLNTAIAPELRVTLD